MTTKIYCGNNKKHHELVSNVSRLGTRHECLKKGIGVGINMPLSVDYAGEFEPIDKSRIYCGNNKVKPQGFTRLGSLPNCLQKGIGVGRRIKATRVNNNVVSDDDQLTQPDILDQLTQPDILDQLTQQDQSDKSDQSDQSNGYNPSNTKSNNIRSNIINRLNDIGMGKLKSKIMNNMNSVHRLIYVDVVICVVVCVVLYIAKPDYILKRKKIDVENIYEEEYTNTIDTKYYIYYCLIYCLIVNIAMVIIFSMV
jgi:hypothetical protein